MFSFDAGDGKYDFVFGRSHWNIFFSCPNVYFGKVGNFHGGLKSKEITRIFVAKNDYFPRLKKCSVLYKCEIIWWNGKWGNTGNISQNCWFL